MAQDLLAEGRRLGVRPTYGIGIGQCVTGCNPCRDYRNKVRAALADEADAKARADRMWSFIDAPLRFPSWPPVLGIDLAVGKSWSATYVPPVPPATPPPPPLRLVIELTNDVIDVYNRLLGANVSTGDLAQLALAIVIENRG